MRKSNKILAMTVVILALLLCATVCFAEGSKDLVENGGYRPYLEWDEVKTTSGISRTNTLQVYAQAGETISLGSSILTAQDGQDIILITPSGETIVCDVTEEVGYIDTLAKEQAGPYPENGGYTPIVYTALETGIYKVQFHSYQMNLPNSTNPYPILANTDFYTTQMLNAKEYKQCAAISAWDVTVKNGDTAIDGRVFTNYLALNLGDKNAAKLIPTISSHVYVLTKDGYLYAVNLNDMDPFGFILFANNRGLIDTTTGKSVYNIGTSGDNNMNLRGGIAVQSPAVPDTDTDITHYIFLNQPAADLPASIPTSPVTVAKVLAASFESEGGTKALKGEGGFFHITFDKATTYHIMIDVNNNGVYDPGLDLLLANAARAGENVFAWDGKDAQGNVLDAGTYGAIINTKGGEYHFPFLDVENNPNGLQIELLNYADAPEGFNPNLVYYDLSAYTTGNGTKVNVANGKGAPATTCALAGVDSRDGVLAFTEEFGDYKALDMWTYVLGNESDMQFEIIAPKPTPITSDYSYIFGRSDELMEAFDGMHRGEAMAVLHRLMKQNDKLGGYVYDINKAPAFLDVEGRWDRSALEYAVYLGIYEATPDLPICPDLTISRGESFKQFALVLGFTDDTTLTYTQYATILQSLGYVEGYEDGSLRLDDPITRAEYCKIYNMIIGRDTYGLKMKNGQTVNAMTYGFTDLDEGTWYYEIMLKATSAYDDDGFVSLEKRGVRNDLDDYLEYTE